MTQRRLHEVHHSHQGTGGPFNNIGPGTYTIVYSIRTLIVPLQDDKLSLYTEQYH